METTEREATFSLKVFLRRLRHCRGFGIQSPTDFCFVNEVVYQRQPFYAYSSLKEKYPDAGRFEIKISRLLFRIANYVQPQNYVLQKSISDCRKAHLTAGCNSAVNGRSLYYNILPSELHDKDCIIIQGITAEGKNQWDKLCSERHERHLLLFDLHYIGIAFVNERRYSELHIVNFY